MTLRQAKEGNEYTVVSVKTEDSEVDAFLFSLGCYAGERIKLVSKRKSGCIIYIKNGRYSIDSLLSDAIEIE